MLVYAHKVLDTIMGVQETSACMTRLFESLVGISPILLTAEPNLTLSESEILLILDSIKQLSQNIPLQHILGKTEFCNLTFQVSDKVLIPRVETEELVYLILRSESRPNLRVIDLGTGCGCIAISLKKLLPLPSHVEATDLSSEALETACTNARLLDAEIVFSKADILSEFSVSQESFDLIVSNPPYVCHSEKKLMHSRVKDHEPSCALFVPDETPLLYYHAIARFASKYLSKNGKVFVEINERFGKETMQCFSEAGFHSRLHQDLFNKDRFVEAWL